MKNTNFLIALLFVTSSLITTSIFAEEQDSQTTETRGCGCGTTCCNKCKCGKCSTNCGCAKPCCKKSIDLSDDVSQASQATSDKEDASKDAN
ncbi:MAG: hypothetical protein NTZ68_00720 [Candidatus Dependentiae bacterium]|nr:hypothetical protein [Candidatus Dependentiae bacterium]